MTNRWVVREIDGYIRRLSSLIKLVVEGRSVSEWVFVCWEVSADQDSSMGSATLNGLVVIWNWPGYDVIWQNKGLDPSASILRPSIQAGFSPQTDMRASMSIHDKYIILTPIYTLNPVDYSLGNYSRQFCCLACSTTPLLSLPSLVNSPTWPWLPIQSFDEAVSAICLAKRKWISE